MLQEEVVAGMRELLRRLDDDTATDDELELVQRLCDFHAGLKVGRQRGAAQAAATVSMRVSPPAGDADDETDWCWFDDGDSIGIYVLLEDGTCGPQIAKVLTENLDDARRWQAAEEARLLSIAPALQRFYTVYVEDLRSRPQLGASAQTHLAELQQLCSPVEGRRPDAD